MSEAKKKAQPCTKWMHHKWLPTRAELAAEALPKLEVDVDEFVGNQTCCFCGDKREIKIAINQELTEE